MARMEQKRDDVFASSNIKPEDFETGRRRTRRGAPKGRGHYFDLVLGPTFRSEENVGREIGKFLNKTKALDYSL